MVGGFLQRGFTARGLLFRNDEESMGPLFLAFQLILRFSNVCSWLLNFRHVLIA